MASAAKTLGLDKGGQGGPGQDSSQQEARPSPMLGPPPQAMGGSMMAGPGYQQNLQPRALAAQSAWQNPYAGLQNQLAQAAMQPTPLQTPPSMPIGQATGMPGLPGTTLNSPSALQYALASGAINPYDLYGGGGSTPPLSMGA